MTQLTLSVTLDLGLGNEEYKTSSASYPWTDTTIAA